MLIRIAWLLVPLALAGCAASVDPAPVEAAADDGATWEIKGEGAVGWVVAVGVSSSSWVGGISEEFCPGLTFEVPEGTRELEVAVMADLGTLGDGVGNMQVRLDGAAGERFEAVWPVDDPVFKARDPSVGQWMLRAWPTGAVVEHKWAVTVDAMGMGAAPPALDVVSMCRS